MRWTASAASLHMATDYTPYEGMELVGRPTTVVVGGRVVVDGGQLVDPTPSGRALHAEPVDLGALARTAPPVIEERAHRDADRGARASGCVRTLP